MMRKPMNEATRHRKLPRQARSEMTVSSIKEAALEIARSQGFPALNTNDIAARAGVSIGTLYQYFPNRESILLGLYEEQTGLLVKAMERRMSQILDLPLREAIFRAASEMLLLFKRNQLILLDLPQQAPELRLTSHVLTFDQLVHRTLRIFLSHKNHEETSKAIEQRAFFIENILIGGIQRYLLQAPPQLPVKDFLTQVTGIIVHYIESPIRSR